MKRADSTRRSKLWRRAEREKGSVLIMTTLVIFALIALIGLAMDGGAMYVNQQKAQAAADAAAQAGVMDMFRGTNSAGGSTYGTAHVCTTNDAWTPCWYARQDGFGGTASDRVTVDFAGPGVTGGTTAAWCSVTGVSLSGSDQVNLICVKVQRTVNTILMQVIGHNTSTVAATAIAAITSGPSQLPILILHPTLSGALSISGAKDNITICGGPSRSVQVNSNSTTSVSGNGTVDLSHAGPLDSGACDTGTGGDFANVGAQTTFPGTLLLGTKPGVYVPSASVIADPLLGVTPPAQPAAAAPSINANTAALESAHNCPTVCTIYSPGYYATSPSLGGFVVFRPGIYWINSGGFHIPQNTIVRMATAAADMSDPTGITNWTQNMLIYNSPSSPSSSDILEVKANSGQLPGNNTYPTSDCPNGGNCLVGSPETSSYQGIFFFQNRSTAKTLSHSVSGGAGLSIKGTLYMTHTAASILSDGTYQSVQVSGGACSSTVFRGAILTDALSMNGNPCITMNLKGDSASSVRQVALVQ